MINIINNKTLKKFRQRDLVAFDPSYINKFDLAQRNFDLVMKEESGIRILKNRRR